ncbi:TPA: Stealth CR1 domain-containing protein [Streptococcus suis]
MDNSIDIVITWVDGNDSKWLQERSKYIDGNINKEGIDNARFRDWGTLKYVLRSIEKNAPWVNRIFLVTANQVPRWYKENDKLTIISHSEFIPEEYLPTFSSHVIECFLHLIPGLSEKFIYFNDDTLILRPSQPEDFFIDNLPVDYATLHLHAVKKSLMIHQIANNSISIINEYFDIKNVLKDRRYQWFNLLYGLKKNLKTLLFSFSPRFSGIEQHHMPQSYLKSTFNEVWLKESETMIETANHKFRHKNDINQWLFRNWQLASGYFYPSSPKYRGLMIDFEKNDEITELNRCLKELQSKKYLMICINDGDDIENLDFIIDKVEEGLENAFSEKASWEI